MRVIMTGGGTGGHIYPAIAIADEIKRRDPKAKILFVGAERGLEKTRWNNLITKLVIIIFWLNMSHIKCTPTISI